MKIRIVRIQPCETNRDLVQLIFVMANGLEAVSGWGPMKRAEARKRAEWMASSLDANIVDACDDHERPHRRMEGGPSQRLTMRYA